MKVVEDLEDIMKSVQAINPYPDTKEWTFCNMILERVNHIMDVHVLEDRQYLDWKESK